MDPIPMDITKLEFEQETGIKEQERKGIINDTSKIASEAIAHVVNFNLRDKETGPSRVVSYDAGNFSQMALSKIITALPLEKTSSGMVLLNPKDPLVSAKTHFLVSAKLIEILDEIRAHCNPNVKDLLNNSLELLELSIDENFDGVDILESLKINGPVSSQEVDKAVAKVLERKLGSINPDKHTQKALGIIEKHLQAPQVMIKFINSYIIDKSKFLLKALQEGHFNKATRLFISLPRSERLELGKSLAGNITTYQLTQFSLALDQEASRHHTSSEVPAGQSPQTFWKELEADRVTFLKTVQKK